MTGQELVHKEETTLIPSEVVGNATTQARLLLDIVEKTGCYQEISGKKYLQVEAWETIGAFNRTHAETESITPIIKDNEVVGYKAHVQLWKDGAIVGGAIMPCYFTENCCQGKERDAKHKASMSAAQTFATSKAYRMNYSYVAILAGYQPTPAEEMIGEDSSPQDHPKEHYCTIHKTDFFMRGKMKSFGHPIGKTGQWCYETKKEPEPVNQATPVAAQDEQGEADKPKEVDSLAWGTLAPILSGLIKDKKATIDSLLKKLADLGADITSTKVQGSYETLNNVGKQNFVDLINK